MVDGTSLITLTVNIPGKFIEFPKHKLLSQCENQKELFGYYYKFMEDAEKCLQPLKKFQSIFLLEGTLIFDLREIPDDETCILVSCHKTFNGITLVNKGKDYIFNYYKAQNEMFYTKNIHYFDKRKNYLDYKTQEVKKSKNKNRKDNNVDDENNNVNICNVGEVEEEEMINKKESNREVLFKFKKQKKEERINKSVNNNTIIQSEIHTKNKENKEKKDKNENNKSNNSKGSLKLTSILKSTYALQELPSQFKHNKVIFLYLC